MILIFGTDRYKVKLAELTAKLEILDKVVHSGNKVPMWYVEDRDELVAKVARLKTILEIKNNENP